MRLTSRDIGAYIYCPTLYFKGRQDKIDSPLNIFERSIRDTFIDAEENVLLKDSIITVKKLMRSWDNIWWPLTMEYKLDVKKAEKKTLKATEKFIDYCNYEISDYLWPTVGVDVESQVYIKNNLLIVHADLIKVDLKSNKKNTVLINFTNRRLSIRDAAFNNEIKTIAYGFYSGGGETITHINININELINKVEMNISTFQPEDMVEIEKMLYHISSGIQNRVQYMNPHACERCNVCKEFKS